VSKVFLPGVFLPGVELTTGSSTSGGRYTFLGWESTGRGAFFVVGWDYGNPSKRGYVYLSPEEILNLMARALQLQPTERGLKQAEDYHLGFRWGEG